jgi:hypothetical protein
MPELPRFTSKRESDKIRGFSTAVKARANLIDVRKVVSSLQFEHLDPINVKSPNIDRAATVRLDRQPNPTAGGANLQVQVNQEALAGVRLNDAGTTVAQVIVPPDIYRTAIACHEKNVRVHLLNVVRSALITSFDSSGFSYRIVMDTK